MSLVGSAAKGRRLFQETSAPRQCGTSRGNKPLQCYRHRIYDIACADLALRADCLLWCGAWEQIPSLQLLDSLHDNCGVTSGSIS